jgi:hypothetical protein
VWFKPTHGYQVSSDNSSSRNDSAGVEATTEAWRNRVFRCVRCRRTLRRVYAKAIDASGSTPLPLLLAPLSPDTLSTAALHAAGWHRFGGDVTPVEGVVVASSDGEELEIWSEGVRLFRSDTEPQGPPSWWDAVAWNEHRVCVALFPAGTPVGTSFNLDSFRDDAVTAQGLLPLEYR